MSAGDGKALALARRWHTAEVRLLSVLTAMGQVEPTQALYASFAIFFVAAAAINVSQHVGALTSVLILNATVLAFWAVPRRAHVLPPQAEALPCKPPSRAVFAELITKPDKREFADTTRWTTLTSHMSHELRTPLNAVIGFSELMTQQAFGPLGASCYDTYAQGIHESGMQLLKTAEDALAITAILTASKKPLAARISNLGALVDDALCFCGAGVPSNTLIPLIEIPRTIEISADAQCVRQMLINIVSDAKARAAPNSSFTITSSVQDDEVELVFALSATNTKLAQSYNVFALTMAATFAELAGANFSCEAHETGSWRARVTFLQVTQRELFC